MEQGSHPYRSVLYVPGSNPRALEKARGLPADALILDLEDAVAPAEKARARAAVGAAVRAGGFGGRRLLIRVNRLDTPWGLDDLAAAARIAPDAILLPKVERPEDVFRAAEMMNSEGAPNTSRLWAMMETPRGVVNAAAIAMSHPRLEGLVMGTNDLAMELGAVETPDRLALLPSLGLCLLAARAAGIVAVDGVCNAFRDAESLRDACIQGRSLGFDGKTLIHPDQLAVANEVFAPSTEDIALAERQVAAFKEAEACGEGVAVVEGRLVENLHVVAARRLIARASAIAAFEADAVPPAVLEPSR